VPTHSRRSRRSRLFVPAFLGLVAFLGLGTVMAGTFASPGTGAIDPAPTGMVAGAIDPAPATPTPATPTPTPPIPARTLAHRAVPTPLPPPARGNDGRDMVRGPIPITGLTGYRWPLPHGRLTLPFGPTPWGSRIVDGETFHDGIDLATFCGDRVVAAHDGTVVAAGRRFDAEIGWHGDLAPYFYRLDEKSLWMTLPIVVVVDDGNEYRSIYAHFGNIVVRKGQTIAAGQLLGYEGATGHASGCHLHYGLFSPLETATFAIDPAVVTRMKIPPAEIARVDPLLVLPPRPDPMPRPSPSASTAP